jgi:superfamily II DNA or RNA helicase
MAVMRLVIPNENPSVLRLVDFQDPHGEIKESLTYTDKAAHFQYLKAKKATYLLSRMGPERFEAHLSELKSQIKKTLLFEDSAGWYTYAGFAKYLSTKLRVPVENQVEYPAPKKLAWANPPAYTPYPFQTLSHDKLLEVKHGGVQIGTGLGKSLIIAMLCRSLGLKTIVMTPATNISEQLYADFVQFFGKKNVGKFFDGKKESKKQIVIANAQSLTKVTEGTPHWEELSATKVFIADESHQCPASTMAAVCFGVASTAPYRFFFSATQMRNDGRDLLLDGITGTIVYDKTVKEGVDEKYLAKPFFRTLGIKSDSDFESSDANEMTRKHLYYNDRVVEQVGRLCNASVAAGNPVLVLIEEVEQFTRLLPYLRHPVRFAHGPLADNREKVPKEFWESDPSELVRGFNSGEYPILVGTSCVSTGTNIKAVKTLIYWQGGRSEIQVKQAIGRATRLTPEKKHCSVIDFDIYNVPTLSRHFKARKAIYEELYPDYRHTVIE